jgi:CheY-like chemotaxis protein
MTQPSASATSAARRLWQRDGARPGTAAELTADAERVAGGIQRRLVRWIGGEGYHLLLQRALVHAREVQPALDGLTCDQGHVRGITEAVEAHGEAKVADGVGVLLAALIDRLGQMVGAEMAELARRLRAEWPDLPVLLMSGFSEEYLRRENMLDFEGIVIQKPFKPEHLVAVIMDALAAR